MIKANYQLSSLFELIEDAAFLEARGYNSTVLWDKEQGELLLLNAVIVDFLKAFQQPTTLDAVVRLFQKGSEDTEKDIKAALKPFFKSMCDRQIIVACKNIEVESKPEMPNDEGLKLGNYNLQKRLTCTPPIDIYVAIDENERKVLLKRLLFAPDFSEKIKPEIRKTFAHEFKMLDILRGCPNICPLIFYDKNADYAVIEFFEGDTLKSLFEKKSPLFLLEQIFILKQVLEAAAFMHSHGVFHGDWHYKNVLVNDDNVVKVIDFDLALTIGQRHKRGLIKGGIKEFIPPERIDDSAFEVTNSHPNFRSEVFQIGVLAYYLFYGDYPFKGETWKKLAFAIKNNEPDYTKLDFPKEITQFLRKAMAKQENDRFESAVEMYGFWSNTFV